MALKHILTIGFNEGRIALPRRSNGNPVKYIFDFENRKIDFFYDEGSNGVVEIGIWKVDERARTMELDFYKIDCLERAIPVFYDERREVLKIGNR